MQACIYVPIECEVLEDEGDLELFDEDGCGNVSATKHSALIMWLVYLIAAIQ